MTMPRRASTLRGCVGAEVGQDEMRWRYYFGARDWGWVGWCGVLGVVREEGDGEVEGRERGVVERKGVSENLEGIVDADNILHFIGVRWVISVRCQCL